MSILIAIALYAAWSSMFSLGKIALQYSPPIFLTGARMWMAGAILIGYLAIRKRSVFKMEKKHFFSLCLLAFFSIYLCNILEFWGLQYLSAAKTCFIYSLSPFFAALFSYLHFKEKMNGRKWLGLGIGFLGFIPVFMTQTGSEDLLNAFSFFSWPELAIMGATLCAVYGWVLMRLVVKDNAVTPIMANGSSMFIGGLFALTHSFFVDSWSPIPVDSGQVGSFLKITLLMTFLSNIICYNIYGMLLKKYTATFLSFVGLLSPIFASLSGWIFLGETPSWIIGASTLIVCFGLWVFYSSELKQGYIVEKKKEAQSA